MVYRDFILPELCKPCLLLYTFQFAKLIVPYPEYIQKGNIFHHLKSFLYTFIYDLLSFKERASAEDQSYELHRGSAVRCAYP